MNEKAAKFKYEKQLPPEEDKKKNVKKSSKKPWVLKSKWKDGIKFREFYKTFKNGVWVEVSSESYSYEELLEMRKNNQLSTSAFYNVFWGPKPFGPTKYKSLKSALTAWENFCKKGETDDRAEYWIENKETGEVRKL